MLPLSSTTNSKSVVSVSDITKKNYVYTGMTSKRKLQIIETCRNSEGKQVFSTVDLRKYVYCDSRGVYPMLAKTGMLVMPIRGQNPGFWYHSVFKANYLHFHRTRAVALRAVTVS